MRKMTLKPYVVATNTNVTCVCMAKSKKDAVRRCKNQYLGEFGELHPEIWEAYDFEKFFLDRDKYERDFDQDVLLLQSAFC